MYDLVAGTQGLTISRFVSPSEARRQFPTLSPTREDGKTLKGTVRAVAARIHGVTCNFYALEASRAWYACQRGSL